MIRASVNLGRGQLPQRLWPRVMKWHTLRSSNRKPIGSAAQAAASAQLEAVPGQWYEAILAGHSWIIVYTQM